MDWNYVGGTPRSTTSPSLRYATDVVVNCLYSAGPAVRKAIGSRDNRSGSGRSRGWPLILPRNWDTALMSVPREFVEQYRTAFMQADLSALVDCFAFPLQVVSATDGEYWSSVA